MKPDETTKRANKLASTMLHRKQTATVLAPNITFIITITTSIIIISIIIITIAIITTVIIVIILVLVVIITIIFVVIIIIDVTITSSIG